MQSRIGTSVYLAGLVAVAALAAAPAPAADYKLDPVHSQVVFKVGHFGVSYNFGRFNEISGTFSFDPASPASAAFDVSIPLASVDTANQKRDDHLRGPDFFNAKQFPVATLKSKSVKKTGEDTYEATADLSLRGATKEVVVKIRYVGSGEDPWGNYRTGFLADLTIDRSAFGISYMPDGIGNEVDLMINIEGTRQ